MRIVRMPAPVCGIAFDIDRTLYTHEAYATSQVDVLVDRLAAERGQERSVTVAEIEEYQQGWGREHDGQRQSLGNVFAALGIPIETSVQWREELIRPADYLAADEKLRDAIEHLCEGRAIVAVTNNPRSVGVGTLVALGVDDLFTDVIGLDTTMRSKPDPEPFRRAAVVLGCSPETVLSVGDRYAVDIAPALLIGMGAIQVDGVADVYDLPEAIDG